jgi:hypothetical protein
MAPDVGMAGQLMIWFSVLIGETLLGLAVLAYAGYSFLTVLINTSAGNEEVIWPGDPYQDSLFMGFYLAWLAAVWAVPAVLVTSLIQPPGWLYVVTAASLVWAVFPITVLSSLSGSSRMMLLRPVIIGLWLKHLQTVVPFYLATAIVVAASCASLYYGTTQSMAVLFVAAPLSAFGILVYARLLGRVGWVITWKTPKKVQRQAPEETSAVVTFDPWHVPGAKPLAKPKPQRSVPRAASKPVVKKKKRPRTKSKSRGYDPWAVPPDEPLRRPAADEEPDDPYAPAKGTYGFAATGAPAPPSPPPVVEQPPALAEPGYGLLAEGTPHSPPPPPPKDSFYDPDQEGYDVTPLKASAPPPVLPPATVAISKFEEELAAPRLHAPPPPHPLTSGVYSFPFYQRSFGSFLAIALGLLLVGCLHSALLRLWPWGS